MGRIETDTDLPQSILLRRPVQSDGLPVPQTMEA